MITTHKIPYGNGELRIGWASWDDGSLTERSVKYAYPDASGKISRGAPELSFDVLVAMLTYAANENEFSFGTGAKVSPDLATLEIAQLLAEASTLRAALLVMQKLIADLPWVKFAKNYDAIGQRYEAIKTEIQV